MNKIVMSDLNNLVTRINRATNHPEEQTGHYIPGQYILSGAYGGHKLEQVCTTGGGVSSITSGYVSKRELYSQMQAILTGLQMKQN